MARHGRPSGPLITDLAPADWDVLEPSAGAGLQVLVEPGSAWVNGHYAEWETQAELTISANSSGSTRVDAIVARLDATANDIELDVVAGTPGAGLPSLTQDSSTWEILLGSSTLTDGGSSVTVADLRSCVGYSAGSFTPTLRMSTTAMTLSSSTGRYIRENGFVRVQFSGTISNVNGGSGNVRLDLPVAAYLQEASTYFYIGQVYSSVSGPLRTQGKVLLDTADPGVVYFVQDADGAGATLQNFSNVTAGRSFTAVFSYEAAH
jgi:hypothetical protein